MKKLSKEEHIARLAALGKTDPHAVRLAALMMCTVAECDDDVRRMLACVALGFSEVEFVRCAEVLAGLGLAEIHDCRWAN